MKKLYLLVLLSCLGLAGRATTYINISGTALNVATNWSTDGTGGGSLASNFATPGDIFLLNNAPSGTSLTNTWTLTDVTLNINRSVTFNGGFATTFLGTTNVVVASTFTVTCNAAGNNLVLGNGSDAPTMTLNSASSLAFSSTTALLTVNTGAILDMGTGTIPTYSGTTITNNGTIKTQNTSATPFIVGKTFGGTGTVEYNGTGAQTIPRETYTCSVLISGDRGTASVTFGTGGTITFNTLTLTATNVSYVTTGTTIAYTGTHTILSALSYANLTSTAGTNTADGAISVSGNLVISAGTLADGGFTITVGGTATFTGAHTSTGSGKILMNGAAGTISGTGGTGNIEFNNAAGFSLAGNTTVTGSLTLTSGQLTVTGRLLTLGTGCTAVTMDATNCIKSVGTGSVTTSGSATITGSLFFDNSVAGNNVLNALSISGSGQTVTLGNNVQVTTTLTITNAGVAPTLDNGGNTIQLTGNISGSGKHTGSGKILMTGGASTQTISSLSQSGNIELDNATNNFSLTGSLTVAGGTLTFTNGNLSLSTSTLNIGSGGTVASMSASKCLKSNGTSSAINITATANVGTLYFDQTSDGTTNKFASVTLNGNTSTKAVMGNNLQVLTTLALTNGKLDLNGQTLTIVGTATTGGATNYLIGSASSNLVATTTTNPTVYFDPTSAGSSNKLNSLTKSGTGTLTVSNDLYVVNALTVSAGTLSMSTGQLFDGGSIAPSITGTLSTACTSTNPIPANISWGGTVTFSANGGQHIPVGTFTNLTLSGTSGTTTPDADMNVSGALTTGSNITLDMGSFKFATAPSSVTNNGTVATSSTNDPALPTGLSWSGTTGRVNFTKTDGAQFIPAGTYKTLACSNTTGTNTARGDIVVNTGTVTATAGGTLDMATYQLSGSFAAAVGNTGTITTQCTVNPAIPAAKSWAGTVSFNNATGGQFLPQGTYATLTLDNTSNSSTGVGTLSVTSAFKQTGASATLDMGTNTFLGAFTTFSVTGTVQTQAATAAFPTSKTFTGNGIIEYNASGAQTLVAGTYNNVKFSGDRGGANFTLPAATVAVSGTVTNSLSNVAYVNTTNTFAYNASAGGQMIVGSIPYNNLLITHAGTGTSTPDANVTCAGTFSTTATSTVDMGNFTLGVTGTPSNLGTLKTQCTVNPCIPTGKTWGGTVLYNYGNGGQSISGGTYGILTLTHTVTATDNAIGNLTSVTTMNISDANTTLDMGTNNIGAITTTPTNGYIKTQCSVSALPASKSWTIPVEYNGSTTTQSVLGGTYSNLIINNTTGTNTVAATFTVTGTLTIQSNATLNMVTSNLVTSGTPTITNNGTLRTQSTTNPPIPSGYNWAGTVMFDRSAGGQSIPTGTYTNLTMGNSSGVNTVTGTLTYTGSLTTTTAGTTNFLTNQLLDDGSVTLTNDGYISTTCTVNPAIPAGRDWSGTTGTVSFAATTGNQHIPQGTYKNLLCSTTSTVNPNIAEGNLVVNNQITTSAAGGILDMQTNQLSGTLTTFTNTGTIKTQCTVNPAIPSGFALVGTVAYDRAAGGQTIVSENSYSTLTLANTSGTQTSAGNLSLTTLNVNTNAAQVLDMGTNNITAVTTVNNIGTIKTSSTVNPLPASKSWGTGTVEYAVTTGGQPIIVGTYGTLVMDNATGTNTASGSLNVSTGLTVPNGGTLDFAAVGHQLLGAFTASMNGTLRTTCTVNPAIPANKTWGGSVELYNGTGGQALGGGTYNNLTLSNSSGIATVVTTALTINNSLTTTSGGTLSLVLNQLLDDGSITLTNNGTISTTCTVNPAIPAGHDWSGTTGTVAFAATTGNQEIPQGTYKNLTCANTSNTNLVQGNLVVNNQITTSGSGGTLDMQTFSLTGSLSTFTNTGTLKTQCTVNPAIPSGFALVGTVNYNNATGGQTVSSETSYTTLTLGNSSGTQTSAGNLSVTTLNNNTNSAQILDMGTNAISAVTTINNSGTIKTSNTGGTPVPAAKNWGTGAVEYAALTGSQSIVQGTYATLELDNTSGINTATGSLSVSASLASASGGTLAFTTQNHQLLGAFTPANNGIIQTVCSVNPAVPTGKVWLGTIEYNKSNGAQTIVTGTYNNLTISNTSGTNSVTATSTVAGDLTLSASSVMTSSVTVTVQGNIAGTGTAIGTGTITATGTGKTISAVTLQNVTINGGATLSLSGNASINGTLTLTSGTLDLGSNNLLLGTGASIGGTPSASAMILTSNTGEIRKSFTGALSGTFTYPVGTLTNYTPLAVTFSSGTGGGGYLAARVTNSKHPANANTTDFLNRYWTLSSSGMTSPVFTCTATYVGGMGVDVDGDETNIKGASYPGSLPWTKYSLVNNVAHTLSTTAISNPNVAISGLAATAPSVTSSASATICSGGSNTVSVTAVTGDPVISYTWAPSAGLSATTGSSVVASPTVTTVYTVTMTDGNAETATSTTTITVTPAPSAAPANNGYICNGGTVNLTANPGGSTSTYAWSGANLSSSTVANPTATPTADETYTLTVTDGTANNGCSISFTTPVVVHATPVASPTNNGYICNGGTVTLTAHPSGGAATYTWSGSNLATSTDENPTATPTATSVYTVTVTDGSSQPGCSPSTQYTTTVSVNPTPTASVNNDGYICNGGTVNLTATPSGGANTYAWSGSNLSSSTAQNPTATPTSTSTYTLTVSDGSTQPGCTPSTQYTTTVSVNPTPSAAPTNDGYICNGGTVNLTAHPANGAITYAWSGSNLSSSTVANPTATPTSTSVYTLTVTDGSMQSGCSPSTQFTTTVSVNPTPVASPVNNGPLCVGGTVTLTATPSGGANTYTWSGSNLSSTTAQNPTATPTSTAVYTVVVSDGSTQSGCTPATQYTTTVTVGAQPTVNIMATTTGYICPTIVETLTATPAGGAGTANYTWSGPAISSPTSSGTTATFTVIPSPSYTMIPTNAAGAYTVSLTFSGIGCNTVSASTSTVTPAVHQWEGGTSTDWHTAGNWICGGVPAMSEDILIPSRSNQPTILAAATGNVNSLYINSSVTLTMNNTSTLNIYGNFKNNGSVTGTSTSNVNLAGSSSQSLTGNGNVYNMTLNNSTGAVIGTSGDTVVIKGALTLTSGTLNTNNRLMLYSNASGTGRIAQITGGAITGNVICQQYFAGGHRTFRHMGHPFTSSVGLSMLIPYIDITGQDGPDNGFTSTYTNNPSAYYYNPLVGNLSLSSDPGWVAFTSTNGAGANSWDRYEGIRILIRGLKGEGIDGALYTPSAVTTRMSGAVNTGSLSIPLTKGATANQEFNLVSNPYPSPVDIGTVIKTAFDAAKLTNNKYWLWDPYSGSSGAWILMMATGTPYYLQENASFYLRTATNGNTLDFTEANKSATISYPLLKSFNDMITLSIYDSAYHAYDMAYIDFNDKATDNDDERLDAGKPMNPAGLSFYSIAADQTSLNLDARPYTSGSVIPLGINSDCQQSFIFKADNFTAPANSKIYLHDKFLKKYTLLTQGAEYRFDINENPMSQGKERFELALDPASITDFVNTNDINLAMMPNPATTDVTLEFTTTGTSNTIVNIMDLKGVTVLTQDLGVQKSGKVTIPVNNLAGGIYMVTLTSGAEKVVRRLVKE